MKHSIGTKSSMNQISSSFCIDYL